MSAHDPSALEFYSVRSVKERPGDLPATQLLQEPPPPAEGTMQIVEILRVIQGLLRVAELQERAVLGAGRVRDEDMWWTMAAHTIHGVGTVRPV